MRLLHTVGAIETRKERTSIRCSANLDDHFEMKISTISPSRSTGEHLKLSNLRKYCFIATRIWQAAAIQLHAEKSHSNVVMVAVQLYNFHVRMDLTK